MPPPPLLSQSLRLSLMPPPPLLSQSLRWLELPLLSILILRGLLGTWFLSAKNLFRAVALVVLFVMRTPTETTLK
jgi:hypothetical protein